MGLDVDRVRARYPALADGYAYLDGAAGTQLPDSVIDAMAGACRAGLGNAGGASRPAAAPTRSPPGAGGPWRTSRAAGPRGSSSART